MQDECDSRCQKLSPHFSPIPSTPANLRPSPSRSEIMTSGWGGGVGWEGVDPPHSDRIIVTRRTVTPDRSGCCIPAKGRNAAGSGGSAWAGAGRRHDLAIKSEAVSLRSLPARPTLAQPADHPPLGQSLAGTASLPINRRAKARPGFRAVPQRGKTDPEPRPRRAGLAHRVGVEAPALTAPARRRGAPWSRPCGPFRRRRAHRPGDRERR